MRSSSSETGANAGRSAGELTVGHLVGLIANLWLTPVALYLFFQAGPEATEADVLDQGWGSQLRREALVGGGT